MIHLQSIAILLCNATTASSKPWAFPFKEVAFNMMLKFCCAYTAEAALDCELTGDSFTTPGFPV